MSYGLPVYMVEGIPEGNIINPSDLKALIIGLSCQSCGHHWEWQPKRSELVAACASYELHMKGTGGRWAEGEIELACPNCSEDVKFKAAIHECGATWIAEPGTEMEDGWWMTEPAIRLLLGRFEVNHP